MDPKTYDLSDDQKLEELGLHVEQYDEPVMVKSTTSFPQANFPLNYMINPVPEVPCPPYFQNGDLLNSISYNYGASSTVSVSPSFLTTQVTETKTMEPHNYWGNPRPREFIEVNENDYHIESVPRKNVRTVNSNESQEPSKLIEYDMDFIINDNGQLIVGTNPMVQPQTANGIQKVVKPIKTYSKKNVWNMPVPENVPLFSPKSIITSHTCSDVDTEVQNIVKAIKEKHAENMKKTPKNVKKPKKVRATKKRYPEVVTPVETNDNFARKPIKTYTRTKKTLPTSSSTVSQCPSTETGPNYVVPIALFTSSVLEENLLTIQSIRKSKNAKTPVKDEPKSVVVCDESNTCTTSVPPLNTLKPLKLDDHNVMISLLEQGVIVGKDSLLNFISTSKKFQPVVVLERCDKVSNKTRLKSSKTCQRLDEGKKRFKVDASPASSSRVSGRKYSQINKAVPKVNPKKCVKRKKSSSNVKTNPNIDTSSINSTDIESSLVKVRLSPISPVKVGLSPISPVKVGLSPISPVKVGLSPISPVKVGLSPISPVKVGLSPISPVKVGLSPISPVKVGSTKTKPSSSLTKPSSSLTKPASSLTKPESYLTKPASSLTKPASSLTKPESSLTKPESSLTKPASSLTKPASSLTKPASSLTKPSSSLTKPASSLTKPASSLTKPASSFTKPASSLTKPSSSLTKPSSSLTKPSSSLTKPSSSLTKPASSLTKPGSSSTKPKSSSTNPINNACSNSGSNQTLPTDALIRSLIDDPLNEEGGGANDKPKGITWQLTSPVFEPDVLNHILETVKNANRKTSENKGITCEICKTRFGCKSTYLSHKRKVHQKIYGFKCSDCNEAFPTKTGYDTHQVEVHNVKLFTCDKCNRHFSIWSLFNEHKKRHNKVYKCYFCPKEFRSITGRKRHMYSHTTKRPFKCDECPKTFDSNIRLKTHKTCHSGAVKITCRRCKEVFEERKLFLDHLFKVHRANDEKHCEICDLQFASKARLTRHNLDQHMDKTKLFNCETCQLPFLTNLALRRHQKSHLKVREFSCKFCLKSFHTSLNLKRHVIENHTDVRPFKCEQCQKSFSTSAYYNSHMKTHRDRHKECPICKKHIILLEPHMKRVHGNKDDQKLDDEEVQRDLESMSAEDLKTKYPCFQCKILFATEREKIEHKCLSKHRRANMRQMFLCLICKRVFDSEKQREEHCAITHVPVTTPQKKKSVFKCTICLQCFDTKEERDEHDFKEHLNADGTKKKSFSCDICGAAYVKNRSLRRHVKTHNPNEVNSFACPICFKTFRYRSYVLTHMVIHGEKSYECQECHRRFADRNALKKHFMIHTGERPYTCQICNKSFNRKATLRLHGLSHTKEQPHQCQFCGKKYRYYCKFRQHMKLHVEVIDNNETILGM